MSEPNRSHLPSVPVPILPACSEESSGSGGFFVAAMLDHILPARIPGGALKLLRFLMVAGLALLAGCGEGVDLSLRGAQAPELASDPPSSLRILVIGGTSGTGLETARLALERGHEVIVSARRPERMQLTLPRLQTMKGDITDAASVADLVEGVDAVVIAVGISPTRDPVTVFSTGTANVLQAMKQHSVERLVAVTGIGAGDSRGHGGFFYDTILQRFVLASIYKDKDRMEDLILDSDGNWTIVRPGFLIDDAARKEYRVIEDLEGVVAGDIARADVAHFIVSALEEGSYAQHSVLLTYPAGR